MEQRVSMCRALPFKLETWNNHVSLTVMPPLGPMASLYRELKVLNWSLAIISERFEAQRNDTVKNLSNAGYEGYTLILRSVNIHPQHTQ